MRYQINLRELLEILKKDKMLILIGTVIITVILMVCSFFFVMPQYATSTQLVGVPNVATTNEINANILSVTTFKDFTKSTVVLSKVIDELGEKELSVGQLRQQIEVTQAPDSQVFAIKVTAETAKEAELLADKTAEVFQTEAKNILKNNSITIVSPAGDDTKKISPNLKLTGAFGIVLGAIVMVVISLFRDFFNGTVKSELYIEETFHIVPLGSVGKIDKRTRQRISHLRLRQSIHTTKK
ncbi:YveK family protein [Enterococcus raffinosus]|uniref:Capsular polysaccharide biosynthesis protein CpsC n=1 Tax=Enterococcus raffinosus TaxID=71452 RepID=A0AAW8T524_9ENTE|nr:Wzz/FepE/Etk N-terminal domain-containing protein [Enterococcus raffinosus]MDT2522026.1 Wzz/FepE/Etk N-terminal domain-containing protein [Enterococcus raffinosus]MDT2528370.1 Wzz/FepE/Etk N-terminal domain-containing protein [Enterococcus raffinosus]MDT2533164.1 Wzz/FepE/Etk N-terminal domain-containing protein [Enterococcus raffinosus]MDT2543604.1 Wzz/FepE/Etk N-terminal domain-containing protein [Enterococcus raffinosus]MDT2553718.1 Wzz/FepE/Etk N-terminal domain-containing protein [Ente